MATAKARKKSSAGTPTKKVKSAAAEALRFGDDAILSADKTVKTKPLAMNRTQAAKIREFVAPKSAARKVTGMRNNRGVIGGLSFATGNLIGKIKRLSKTN